MKKSPIVVDRLATNLTPEEYKQCIRSCYKDGNLRPDLIRTRDKFPHAGSQVVMCKEGSRIRAWALIDRSYGTRGEPVVQIWTQHRHRRKGLGSKVMQRVKDLIGDTFQHYRRDAPEFFSANEVIYGSTQNQ